MGAAKRKTARPPPRTAKAHEGANPKAAKGRRAGDGTQGNEGESGRRRNRNKQGRGRGRGGGGNHRKEVCLSCFYCIKGSAAMLKSVWKTNERSLYKRQGKRHPNRCSKKTGGEGAPRAKPTRSRAPPEPGAHLAGKNRRKHAPAASP